MEDLDIEFRTVLVKVADRISTNELQTLRFIFSDHIRRDGDTVAVNFFQQLLDRNIIDKQNFSILIRALEDTSCHRAAQLLKNYQEPSPLHQSLWKDMCDDEVLDKQSMHEFVPEIDRKLVKDSFDPIVELASDHEQISLCNNQENAMPTFGKTKRKTRTIISVTLSIAFLLYTIILVGISYYWVLKMSDETKSLYPVQWCQPSAFERYFIKSRHTGKLIGITNTANEQGDRLYQWNDTQNQLCQNQWHFVPVTSSNGTYIIQSVYNRKVFDISAGNVSNSNAILHWDMAMNDIHQQFHLTANPNEDSCFIQSLATENILDAKTMDFITQTDLDIYKNESIVDQHNLLWQLIPFDTNRPGEKWTDCPYVSSIDDLTVIKFGKIFGTDTSYSTDDSKNSRLTTSHFISLISLTSSESEKLDSIKFIYSSSNWLNVQSSESGILRGHPAISHRAYRNVTFNVTEKSIHERINRVSLVVHPKKGDPKAPTLRIVGIQFHTTFNRTSPFYGSQEGQRYTEEYRGFILGYVRGGSSMYIEKLQLIWYKV